MKYNQLTLGQIEAIINKIGGIPGVENFLAGRLLVKPNPTKYNYWKTVNGKAFVIVKPSELGFTKNFTPPELLQAALANGLQVCTSDDAIKVAAEVDCPVGIRFGMERFASEQHNYPVIFRTCNDESFLEKCAAYDHVAWFQNDYPFFFILPQ